MSRANSAGTDKQATNRATQSHELSLSDGVLLLAFGSVDEVDGLEIPRPSVLERVRSDSGLADMAGPPVSGL